MPFTVVRQEDGRSQPEPAFTEEVVPETAEGQGEEKIARHGGCFDAAADLEGDHGGEGASAEETEDIEVFLVGVHEGREAVEDGDGVVVFEGVANGVVIGELGVEPGDFGGAVADEEATWRVRGHLGVDILVDHVHTAGGIDDGPLRFEGKDHPKHGGCADEADGDDEQPRPAAEPRPTRAAGVRQKAQHNGAGEDSVFAEAVDEREEAQAKPKQTEQPLPQREMSRAGGQAG